MADDMELNVKLAMESQSFQNQITIINREMKVAQAEFASASSALGNFGNEEQKLELKSQTLASQIQMSQQKVDLLTAAHEKARQTLATNVTANEELRQSLERTTNAYNQSVTATGANSAESLQLKAAMDALNTQYTQSNTLILRNATSADNLNIRLQNTQAAQNRLQNELTATNTDLEAQRNGMNDVGESADEGGTKVGGFGAKIAEIGNKAMLAGIAALGAAFTAVAGVGVIMSDDLQKAMNGIQSETGATDESMGGLKDSLMGIYNDNYGENFDDIAKSMSLIGRETGVTGDELKGLTENAILLRDTFDMEVGDSVKTVNQLIKQFGIDGQTAYNLIAQGAQQGMNKNGDLLDVIGEYSVKFAGLGLSAEDMFNALNNGAKAGGFSIDVMGDAMKEFAISTSGPNLKAASEVFQTMGLDAAKLADGFTKGGAAGKAAFQEVIQSLGNMKDPVAQNTAGVALFGTMWEDLGSKSILALGNTTGGINSATDAMKKINEVKYNDFGSVIEGLKRQLITGLALPMSQEIMPKMREFSTYLSQNMPQIIEGIKPVISGLIGTFELLANNLKIIIPVLSGVLSGIVAYKAISAVSGLIASFRAVTLGAAGAQAIFNAVLLANPIGAVAVVIGLVIAAGVALWMNWDKIKAKALEIFGSLSSTIGGALDTVKQVVTTAWTSIAGAFTAAWEGIKSGLSSAWESISSVTSSAWETIKGVITGVWEAITVGVTSALSTISGAVTDGFNAVKSAIEPIWDGIKKYFTGVWDAIKTIFLGALLLILDIVTGDFGKMSTDAQGIWNKLKEAFGQIWLGIQQVFDGALKLISGLLTLAWSTITSALESAWDAIKNYFVTLWESIKSTASGAWEAFKTTIVTITATITSTIKTTWEAILTWFSTLPARLKQYAVDMFGAMKDGVAATVPAVKTAVTDGLESAWTYIKGLPASALQWGADIIQGLINGIQSMIAGVGKIVGDLAEMIKKKIRDALGISSPSRVMFGYGENISQGLADGIASKASSVSSSVDSVTGDIETMVADRIAAINAEVDAINQQTIDEEKAAKEQEFNAKQSDLQKTLDKTRSAKERAAIQKEIDDNAAAYAKEQADEERKVRLANLKTEAQDLEKANQEYDTKVQQRNAKLASDIQKLNDTYDNALASKTQSIYNSTGLFDSFKSNDTSADALLKNLQSQVDGVDSWQENIAALSKKGIDDGLLKELTDMGPKAAGEIKALTTMSDTQLQQYTDLWKKKNEQAKDGAIDQLKDLKAQTTTQIQDLTAQANADLEAYRATWYNQIESITGTTISQFDGVKNLSTESVSWGESIMDGLADGIKSRIQTVTSMLSSAVSEIQSVGSNVNFSPAITSGSNASALSEATSNKATSSANNSSPSVSSDSGNKGITQTVIINSPTALTPSEIARQSKNAMRELALSF